MIAAVRIPDFYLQAWLRSHHSERNNALGLVDSQTVRGGSKILSFSREAVSQGLCPGMTVAQAKARYSNLVVISRHQPSEDAALSAMRDVLWGRSPLVSMGKQSDPGWAYVQTRGLLRIFGTIQDWVGALAQDLSNVGLEGVIGVAPGWQQARVLAFAGGGMLEDARSLSCFKRMRCEVLEPSRELLLLFERLGISRVEDFLRIDPADILEHMGEEALVKHQIIRGEEPGTPLVFEEYQVVFEEEHRLEEAIADLEPLFFILRPLLERLLRRLSVRGYYSRGIELYFSYDGAGSESRTVRAGCPTRSTKVLFELCRLSLERDPPKESIEVVQIRADPCKVDSHQLDFFNSDTVPHEEISLTVTKLKGVFGEKHVGSPRLSNSYREDAIEMTAFHIESTCSVDSKAAVLPVVCLRRYRPAQRIKILCREHRLVYLEGKYFSGKINRWHGPYRLCGEWWHKKPADAHRGFLGDLYDVEVKDKIYRVSWDHHKRAWLALGWYD